MTLNDYNFDEETIAMIREFARMFNAQKMWIIDKNK